MRKWPCAFWGDIMPEQLKTLKLLLGLSDSTQDALLTVLLQNAENAVLSYTRRTVLPDALCAQVVQLALVAYNRMGAEGETARSEGGISQSFDDDMPESVRRILNRYIKARVI